MIMLRIKLIELERALNQLSNEGSAKFKYATFKNLNKIEADIKSIKSVNDNNLAILKDYNDAKNEIVTKYGEKQENGSFVVKEDSEKYADATKELEKLNEDSKETIDKFKAASAEFDKFLNEEIEFEGHAIDINEVPEDIQAPLLKVLMDTGLIKE